MGLGGVCGRKSRVYKMRLEIEKKKVAKLKA